jgi:tRNA pseudouridine synthase 8/2,5-diamino-6-(5-phospho-D-ribitylamino)-pyrimidin-4(3H)-one deaminase
MSTTIATGPTHLSHLRLALSEAQKCVPTPTAYCVGAVLVGSDGRVLSTGYSRELPGNTHAEQCALDKLLPLAPLDGSVLYTTMEPCSERLSGNKPCLFRILEAGGIGTVYVGVKEPATFVKENIAEKVLGERGVSYVHVPGLEKEILECAERGHEKTI